MLRAIENQVKKTLRLCANMKSSVLTFALLQYPMIPLNSDVTDRFPANLARLKVWFRPPNIFSQPKL